MKLKRILKWIAVAISSVVALATLALFIAYWRSDNDCGRNTTEGSNTMKAIVYCDYGSPDVLKLRGDRETRSE